MIVRHANTEQGGTNHSTFPAGSSLRLLTRVDGVGFSLHDTNLKAGSTLDLWYKNHIEANYVIEGTGVLTNVETGEEFDVRPGFMYTLDKHDRHQMTTTSDMRIICVFTPALVGSEKHDEDGSYPLL